MWLLLGWLKLVVRERRRAVNGVGKGGGRRDMAAAAEDDVDDNSSIVVSRPSKKVIKSGTGLGKGSVVVVVVVMVLVLLLRVCIMGTSASDGQLRLEANVVW